MACAELQNQGQPADDGYDFRKEMERLAGVAASLMLSRSDEIRRRFPGLLGSGA